MYRFSRGVVFNKLKQRFNSFSELSLHKKEGEDYTIVVHEVPSSPVSIVAPHGGVIEWNTSEMAKEIAANDHNLYSFEGKDQDNAFYELHVTSSCFDEPKCLDLIAKTEVTITIHGCRGDEPVVYLGGRDEKRKRSLSEEFNKHGIKAMTDGHPFFGTSPDNICNKNQQKAGVQLEFSRGIRDRAELRGKCVKIIRDHLSN